MNFIKEEVKKLENELIEIRRDIHMHPELGFEEYRTSEKIYQYLMDLGLVVKKDVAKTGVVALLEGKGTGNTIILRADMDALPIKEELSVEYKSIYEGKMHACGHDGHVAMMLVAAKILTGMRDDLNGNIKFVFQPNEEEAGAYLMIKEGILENPKVDAAFGLHLWSPIDVGKVGVKKGALMASSHYFKINVRGKGGHGGSPHTANNPILAGIDIIKALQQMVINEVDALKPTIITFGKINAGTSPIIIPEEIVIEGSLRCLHEDDKDIRDRCNQIVRNISKVSKVDASIEFRLGNTLLKNDKEMTSLAESICKEVVGEKNIESSNISVMLGEDFSEFSNRVPSTFIFVGSRNDKTDKAYPHHHPKFDIDERGLLVGTEILVKVAKEYLK